MTACAAARRSKSAPAIAAIALALVAACGGPAGSPAATATFVPEISSAAPTAAAIATAPNATAPQPIATAPLATAAAACTAPPPGMVAWWRAENDAKDAIGSDDGTAKSGASFGPGIDGQAFTFDGASQYVEISNASNLQLQHAITIEGWVLASGAPNAYAGIAGTWDDNTGANRSYLFWLLNGQLELVLSTDGSSVIRATDPTPITVDRWTHVAGTYDGSTIRVYVDGAEVGHTSMTGDLAVNQRPFTIGRTDGGSVGTPNLWHGSIDELSIYDRALGAGEIAGIQAAGSAGKCHA